VVKLQKDLEKYEEVFWKVWNSLSATVNHYNAANKRLEIIDTDIFKITAGEAGGTVHFEELKKPEINW
jgi:septation ring formation regulator EzrA